MPGRVKCEQVEGMRVDLTNLVSLEVEGRRMLGSSIQRAAKGNS